MSHWCSLPSFASMRIFRLRAPGVLPESREVSGKEPETSSVHRPLSIPVGLNYWSGWAGIQAGTEREC
jgi:hypothetical protein